MAAEGASVTLRPARPAFWNNPTVRGIAYQVLFVAAVVGGALQ